MKIYITSESAISPQKSDTSLWESNPGIPVDNAYSCIEPSYAEYLDPRATRRMSRMMKMGITAALMCVRNSSVENPDAILTATGFGCLEDTAAFLAKLSHEDGQLLNPTPFIQSTHNTVAGAIALHLKCKSYNNTFTQRSFSFESALMDAQLLFHENNNYNILLGSIDEAVDSEKQIIKQLRGLKASNSKMVPLGEGASFFMLSSQYTADALTLSCFKTFYKARDEHLLTAYKEMKDTDGAPDLILLGTNGSVSNDKHYHWISSLQNDIPVISYKQYCGEYPTAPAFAHWMACNILRNGYPGFPSIKRILIYNQSEGRNHSFTLINK